MGFTELLTLIFVVAKIAGLISWSWWLVLLPEIIAMAVYLFLILLTLIVPILDYIDEKKKESKRK